MRAFEKIEKAIASGFIREIATGRREQLPPLSEDQVRELEAQLSLPLSAEYKRLLLRWNGLDMGMLRICGGPESFWSIIDEQWHEELAASGLLIVGSDPCGFMYGEDREGRIHQFDTDGGDLEKIAESLDDFISEVYLGASSKEHYGEKWLEDLRQYGLV